MVDITVATGFTARPPLVDLQRRMRRILAFLRLRRIERRRRRVLRLILNEVDDPRALADIGIDGRRIGRRHRRFEATAAAVGGLRPVVDPSALRL